MALEKQGIGINFSQGLDTKTDPNQIPIGKFLSLENAVFNKGGLLQKRNGFGSLTSLPDTTSTSLATYNDNLVAIGSSLYAFSENTEQWFNKGNINPVSVSVTPLVRNSNFQSTVDSAVYNGNIVCTVWAESNGSKYYEVLDSNNGNVLTSQTLLPAGCVNPRVFLVGTNFVITFMITITATVHLRYIAVPALNSNSPGPATDISAQVSNINAAYDGAIINGSFYIAWDASDLGGAIRIAWIDAFLNFHIVTVIAGHNAARLSVCGDTPNGDVWVTFLDSSNNLYTLARNFMLAPVLAPTLVLATTALNNITSSAQNNINTIIYETIHTYSYNSTPTDFISKKTVTITGTISSATVIRRSVGLASKSFIFNSNIYFLSAYSGAFQPTYFLLDTSGNIISKIAYSNGGGYPSTQILPGYNINGDTVSIGYLFKDQIIAVNKTQQVASVGGVFGQLGINLVNFTFNASVQTVEIGGALHINGGYLRMYDGAELVEHSFFLWPEDLAATTASTTGFMTAQLYFYQATYEWTDSQGNIHRSAPSLPLQVDLTSSMTSTNKVTVNVPTLRMTNKVGTNKVRIVLYRWSLAQQNYYQVTSITSPVLNDTTIDSVAIVDTLADSSIIGNPLIYTTGGVIENIAAPACNAMALYKSRLFLIDAEDTNLVWYSKVVIETTPVELSDLFTIFVAPTTGASGSTGVAKVLFPMDDKLILYKPDAAYYLTGTGPDNTGANNDFSDFIFITSTVGCSNPQSAVFMPQGIISQSDKGLWLLGRDLSSQYIGAPVEAFNSSNVLSALTVPGTNQVRFTMDSNVTLMYDYYYQQWGTFNNINGISSVLLQGKHTYLNKFGQVFQETPGNYLDGSNPVLMSFITGWLNLTGLQGYERAYFLYFLGQFYSPHKVQIQIGYDYNPNPTQTTFFMPDNYNTPWGGDSLWGSSSPWGGNSQVEQFRVFLEKQKCEAFQIILNEVYDSSFGVQAGLGLTLSGINLVVGAKSKYPRIAPKYSVG